MSFMHSLYSIISRADTSSPHVSSGNQTPLQVSYSASPTSMNPSPIPHGFDPSRCPSPAVLGVNIAEAKSELTKPILKKSSPDLQPLEQRIALRFEEIFKKTNDSKDVTRLCEAGWLTEVAQVLNLKGELKEKQFHIHNSHLTQSAQASTHPAVRVSKNGKIKAYVSCTQKDTSEKSQIAFDDKKLDLFARASFVQAAPKIYLYPNPEASLEEGSKQKKYQCAFITKFVDNGDLINFLTKTNISDSERIAISRKLIIQLSKLHASGIFHRDIKPDNVLMDEAASEVKICDYGLATDQLYSEERPCSREYAPPEYEQNYFAGQLYSFKSTKKETVQTSFNTAKQDHYTLGLTIFSILTVTIYYESLKRFIKSNRQQLRPTFSQCQSLEDFIDWKQKLSDRIIDEQLSEYPSNIIALVKGLIQYNPENRISFEQALELLDQ